MAEGLRQWRVAPHSTCLGNGERDRSLVIAKYSSGGQRISLDTVCTPLVIAPS